MKLSSYSKGTFDLLIVGGREAALALRDLGDERFARTVIAPDPEFVYRPTSVRAPFRYGGAAYPLEEIVRDIRVELRADSFRSSSSSRWPGRCRFRSWREHHYRTHAGGPPS